MNEKEFHYEFTVVSAVYNAEEFLHDFFDSMLRQTVGFEKIQLIMIDDGSPDRSGEICDSYAEKYPENIFVIHKENGGAASARSEGLRHANGRYVTFTDPDDTISAETMEKVAEFFKSHGEEVKLVAIPIKLFGFASGDHHLNKKFENGERVISVLKEGEHTYPQLSISSTFIKADVASKIEFNPNLVIAEDAEQVSKILVDHPYLGVLPSAAYNYRRYDGSQVASAKTKLAWYNPYLKHFSLEVMHYAKNKLGYIPRFIQYTVMCDLQWKFVLKDAPAILTKDESDKFFKLLYECVALIDDDIILMQESLKTNTKLYILRKKHAADIPCFSAKDDYIYGDPVSPFARFSEADTRLDRFTADNESIYFSIRQNCFKFATLPNDIYITVGGEKIYANLSSVEKGELCLGEEISTVIAKDFSISRSLLRNKAQKLEIHTIIGGCDIIAKGFVNGTAFPFSTTLKDAYAIVNDLIIKISDEAILIEPYTYFKKLCLEFKFIASLLKSGKKGAKKAAAVRFLLPLYRFLQTKPVWIISDRKNKAGDNGEAFFRHLKEINYKGAKYYFAINKCADFERLKPLGNVIKRSGWFYKMRHLTASKIISSHADDFVTNPFEAYKGPYLDILNQQDFIFLQHGVIKDDLSGWLNKYSKNIRGFITSAEPEYRSIIDTPSYHYTEREIWLTGLPRFDRLYHDEKKYITVMPTWRRYLMDGLDAATGVWKESAAFKSSCYFRFYNDLLNSPRLLNAAEELGYTLCYLPHPNVITNIGDFDRDPRVKFFTIDDEYRKIYAESSLILTDYSSAVFDFAYLRKPIVYTQFDKDEFFAGEHVYTKGYFDYERDGFGEVVYDLESTIDSLISYMKGDCKLKDKYRARIDSFFAYSDQNNSDRILKMIENL